MMTGYRVSREVKVPMRDGVPLATDLWLPDCGEAVPAILFRTPYDKSQLSSDFIRPQQLVEAGFAVLVQDTRGRFASEGEWAPLNWDNEGRDGYDTIEWAAEQPWCNGAIGMAGTSYCGVVQLAAAALRPPHLRAIAPAMAGVAKLEQCETNGAFWLDHLFGWLCFVGLDWAQSIQDKQSELLLQGFLADPAELRLAFPLEASPLFALPGFPVRFDRLTQSPVMPDIDPAGLDVAILSIGGWFDLYVRSSLGIGSDESGRNDRHLVIGPWAHSNFLPAIQGGIHFGLAASGLGAQLSACHIAFFDRYLRDHDAPLPQVRYFEMLGAGWKEASAWPPDCEKQQMYAAGKSLTDAPSDSAALLEYQFDNPAPTLGGRLMALGHMVPGPLDQRPLESHSGVIYFDTCALSEAITIVGSATVQAELCCDREGFDLTAKLVDVGPDGLATFVTDGTVRLSSLDCTSAQTVEICLADTAWRFAAGHRIRLQLQSANFPHFDRNPKAGDRALATLQDIRISLPTSHTEANA